MAALWNRAGHYIFVTVSCSTVSWHPSDIQCTLIKALRHEFKTCSRALILHACCAADVEKSMSHVRRVISRDKNVLHCIAVRRSERCIFDNSACLLISHGLAPSRRLDVGDGLSCRRRPCFATLSSALEM